jgi:signal transduction histidine kinase
MSPPLKSTSLEAVPLLAFQAARDAFVAVGADGRIVLANPAAGVLLGNPPEKLSGAPLALGSGESPSALRFLHPARGEVVLGIEPVPGEGAGDVKLYRLTAGPRGETPEQESLGVLAGGIAHKFNNLLTSILGFASLASREAASPLVRSALQQIEDSSHQAAAICSKVLAYAGKGRFAAERADLGAIVRDHFAQLEALARGGVVLQLELANDVPAVLADRGLVVEALLELVTNSSEAIADSRSGVDASTRPPSGRITVRTKRVQASREELLGMYLGKDRLAGEYSVLEVADTGRGMDDSVKARLFEPFSTTKYIGRGLGLSAVLGIVRRHQGAIAVESSPGQGTTIQLFFPALTVSSPEVAAVPAATTWRGSGLVLVVDEDEGVRRFAVLMLEMSGFSVLQAGTEAEALEVVRSRGGELRLVLLDLTASRQVDLALEEMQRVVPELPVVLMSDFSENELAHHSAAKKLSGFLQKPFTPRDLEACVRAALGGS